MKCSCGMLHVTCVAECVHACICACVHAFVCILASAVIAEAHVLCLISFNIQLSLLRQ